MHCKVHLNCCMRLCASLGTDCFRILAAIKLFYPTCKPFLTDFLSRTLYYSQLLLLLKVVFLVVYWKNLLHYSAVQAKNCPFDLHTSPFKIALLAILEPLSWEKSHKRRRRDSLRSFSLLPRQTLSNVISSQLLLKANFLCSFLESTSSNNNNVLFFFNCVNGSILVSLILVDFAEACFSSWRMKGRRIDSIAAAVVTTQKVSLSPSFPPSW